MSARSLSQVDRSAAASPASPAPAAREATKATEVPAEVREALGALGQPLDAGLRAALSPRVGIDLGRVRVHTDARAAAAAASVGAEAFAVGRHIVFGAGRWAPRHPAGRALLLHELSHVAEQRAVDPPPVRLSVVDDPGAERAAEAPFFRRASPPPRAACVQRRPLTAGPVRPEAVDPGDAHREKAEEAQRGAAGQAQAKAEEIDRRQVELAEVAIREAIKGKNALGVLNSLRALRPGQRQALAARAADLWSLLGIWMGRQNQIAAHALLAGVSEQGPHMDLIQALALLRLDRAWTIVRDLSSVVRDRLADDYDAAFGRLNLDSAVGRGPQGLAGHLSFVGRYDPERSTGSRNPTAPNRVAAIAAALDAPWELGEASATAIFCELNAGEHQTLVDSLVRLWRRGVVYLPVTLLIETWDALYYKGIGWRRPALAALRGAPLPLRTSLDRRLDEQHRSAIEGLWTQFEDERSARILERDSADALLRTLRGFLNPPPGSLGTRSLDASGLRRWLQRLSFTRRLQVLTAYAQETNKLPSHALGARYSINQVIPEDDVVDLALLAGLDLSDPAARFGVAVHHFVDIDLATQVLLQLGAEPVIRVALRTFYEGAFRTIRDANVGPQEFAIRRHAYLRLTRAPDWQRRRILTLLEHRLSEAEELHFELEAGRVDAATERVNKPLRAGLDAFSALYNDWERYVRVPVPPEGAALNPKPMWTALERGLGERFGYVREVWARLRAQAAVSSRANTRLVPGQVLDDLKAAQRAGVHRLVLEELAAELGRSIAETRTKFGDREADLEIRLAARVYGGFPEPIQTITRALVDSGGEHGSSIAAAAIDPGNGAEARELLKAVTVAWAQGDVADLRKRLQRTSASLLSRPSTYTTFRFIRLMLEDEQPPAKVAAKRLYEELFNNATFTLGDSPLASAADFMDIVAKEAAAIVPAIPRFFLDLVPSTRRRGEPPGSELDKALWVIFNANPELSRDRLRLEGALRGPATTAQEALVRGAQGLASARQSVLYPLQRYLETPGDGRAPARAAEHQLSVIASLTAEERRDPAALRRRLELLYGAKEAAKLTDGLLKQMIGLLNEAAVARAALADVFANIAESLIRLGVSALLGPVGVGGLITGWIATAGAVAVREFLLGVDHNTFSATYASLLSADVARALYANRAYDVKLANWLGKVFTVKGELTADALRGGLVESFKFVTQESLETVFERAVNERIPFDTNLVVGKAVSAFTQGALASFDRAIFANADFINMFEYKASQGLRSIAHTFAFGVPSKASWPRALAAEAILLSRQSDLTLQTLLDRLGVVTVRTLTLSAGAGLGTSLYRRWEGERGRAILTNNDGPKIQAADKAILAAASVQTQRLKEYVSKFPEAAGRPTRFIAERIAAGDPQARQLGQALQVSLATAAFGAADPNTLRGANEVLRRLSGVPLDPPPPRGDQLRSVLAEAQRAVRTVNVVVEGRNLIVTPGDSVSTLRRRFEQAPPGAPAVIPGSRRPRR